MIKSRASEAGFTLIEVVVALVILAISFGVLMRIFSSTIEQTSEAENETVADSLLESMLDEFGNNVSIVDGDTEGQFSNGFTWHLHVAPYGTADDRSAWPVAAHEVLAEVGWTSGGGQRSISRVTLRLTPKAQSK